MAEDISQSITPCAEETVPVALGVMWDRLGYALEFLFVSTTLRVSLCLPEEPDRGARVYPTDSIAPTI